jgi:hypothetical protein
MGGEDGRDGEDGEDGTQGAVGPAGPSGPQGAKGEPGDDAAGYQPRFWASCDRTVDLVFSDGIEETLLDYTLIRFTNGDLDVSCLVGAGSAEQSSNQIYYPELTNGATSGACLTPLDYPPTSDGTVGMWRFTSTAELGPRATYSDVSSHPLNNRQVPFTENDCHVYTMDAKGEWSDSSLGEMF